MKRTGERTLTVNGQRLEGHVVPSAMVSEADRSDNDNKVAVEVTF